MEATKTMPVTKRKLPSGMVQVRTPSGIKAKGTTPAKAAAQTRLLNAVEHGWTPTGGKNAMARRMKGG